MEDKNDFVRFLPAGETVKHTTSIFLMERLKYVLKVGETLEEKKVEGNKQAV